MTDPESVGDAAAGDFVQSLARGLAVIRAFDAEHPELTLSDVARRAGLTRAASRRFLLTLESLGYVRASSGSATGTAGTRAFALTPRVLELGFSYLSSLSLPEIVQPHLERLSREVDESVSAAVLDGADIVYIARVPTRRIMSVRITIGTRFPAYATSMGRVLLAGLSDAQADAVLRSAPLDALTAHTLSDPAAVGAELVRVRAQGWALVDGELEQGLRSVAAPIHDRTGRVIAAINVSMGAGAGSAGDAVRQIVPALRRAAAEIDAEVQLV